MIVRPASAADVEAVRRLVGDAFRPYVARIGREPAPMAADHQHAVAEGRCWVAEDNGRLVGMLEITTTLEYLEIETIAVAPDAQGRGVGARLLSFADERARALHVREVRLYTNEAMTENLAYYPRRGFLETGRATQDGYRRVFFAKEVLHTGTDGVH